MTRKTYRVLGMTCPNCAMNLEAIEEDLPGIQLVLANYRKGRMEVEFDETRVSEAEILAAVARRGYQAEPG